MYSRMLNWEIDGAERENEEGDDFLKKGEIYKW